MFSFSWKKTRLSQKVFKGIALAGLVLFFLTGALVVSCDNDPDPGPTPINAATPTISVQPQGGTFDVGTANTFSLTVTASKSDNGTLSYQWYSNASNSTTGGTEIDGETDETLTLDATDYETDGNYYFYVLVTNTNNSVTGNKTTSKASNAATVTVTGNSGGTNPPEFTIPEDLKGTWTSTTDEKEVYIITDTTFTSQYDGDVGYEGTIVNHRADGSGAGYITIQYTTAGYYSDGVGYFYVIHYKNLTSTTILIAGAYDSDGPEFTTDLTGGKSTWQEADAAYTVENDCFAWYSDCTKGGGGNEVSELTITTQPQGGTVNITSAGTLNLKVVAANPNAGTLSYQWYSNTANSNTGGTVISGKTSDTLTISNTDYTTNRTFYFYVVVTNATSSETVTSNAVTVTITGSTTTTYFPWDAEFETHMDFFAEGIWADMDAYHIHKWEDFDSDHYDRAEELFFSIRDRDNLITYSSLKKPANGDYVIMYDDDAMGFADGGYGFAYMGLVRAVNVSTADPDKGAFIIEYFEGTDPQWLWDPDGYSYQDLLPGDVPFFGFYYEKTGVKNDKDTAMFGNTTDQSADYVPPYYTETETLEEAINKINMANMELYVYLPLFGGPWVRYDCEDWLPVEGW
jgi:hypothetical protein